MRLEARVERTGTTSAHPRQRLRVATPASTDAADTHATPRCRRAARARWHVASARHGRKASRPRRLAGRAARARHEVVERALVVQAARLAQAERVHLVLGSQSQPGHSASPRRHVAQAARRRSRASWNRQRRRIALRGPPGRPRANPLGRRPSSTPDDGLAATRRALLGHRGVWRPPSRLHRLGPVAPSRPYAELRTRPLQRRRRDTLTRTPYRRPNLYSMGADQEASPSVSLQTDVPSVPSWRQHTRLLGVRADGGLSAWRRTVTAHRRRMALPPIADRVLIVPRRLPQDGRRLDGRAPCCPARASPPCSTTTASTTASTTWTSTVDGTRAMGGRRWSPGCTIARPTSRGRGIEVACQDGEGALTRWRGSSNACRCATSSLRRDRARRAERRREERGTIGRSAVS